MALRNTVLFTILGIIFGLASASGQDAPPRYKLMVGQEIQYQSCSDLKYDIGGSCHLEFTCAFWVVGCNGDDSWRVVERRTSVYRQSGTVWPPAGDESMEVGRFNIFPDGRIKVTDGSIAPPLAVLPRLPDAVTDRKWRETLSGGLTYNYSATSHNATKDFVFSYDVHSPNYDLDLLKDTGTLNFDVQQGLVRSGTTEWYRGRGHTCKGSGVLTLKSVLMKDAAFIQQLTSESDVYFKATAAYTRALSDAREDPADAASILKGAQKDLKDARGRIVLQLLASLLDKTLAQHNTKVKGIEQANEEESRHIATMLNKAAADWELKDLGGKTHRLSDYHGKVVLLDFWYARCGYCIDAMPQVKQVADDFKREPVVVLGMNTDEDEKDAQLVAEQMSLNYDNLRAHGIPEKYGVDGFPTAILIDPKGVVRAVHIGYSAHLRDELDREVREFLPSKTAGRPASAGDTLRP